MNAQLKLLQGLHPGIIVNREIIKRKISKVQLAIALDEFPQTLGAIINGKRRMNIPLSLKLEKFLNVEEGFFMMLQLFFDIKMEKLKQEKSKSPDLSKFRPVVFWDTKIDRIDWEKQKEAVISRVMQRGNSTEKEEIIRFYGRETVEQLLQVAAH
jgi:plasmid maintenance system antidote protein VapI